MRQLQVQEKIILSCLDQPFKMGYALRKIRDEKLFKQTHKTMTKYCQEKWCISKSGLYSKISIVDIKDALEANNLPDLTNESQAIALNKIRKNRELDFPNILKIWKKVNSQKKHSLTYDYISKVIREEYKCVEEDVYKMIKSQENNIDSLCDYVISTYETIDDEMMLGIDGMIKKLSKLKKTFS